MSVWVVARIQLSVPPFLTTSLSCPALSCPVLPCPALPNAKKHHSLVIMHTNTDRIRPSVRPLVCSSFRLPARPSVRSPRDKKQHMYDYRIWSTRLKHCSPARSSTASSSQAPASTVPSQPNLGRVWWPRVRGVSLRSCQGCPNCV